MTEAEIVLALRAAGCVFAEDEARLLVEAAVADELEMLVRRRVDGEPLEVILGWADFAGLRIIIEPGVFVPRQRTMLLVDRAVDLAGPEDLVVDLCCGSGALGAALATRVPGARVIAADIEPSAVRCARRNLDPLGGSVFEGDLYAALPGALRGTVNILMVNAPYVPTEAVALMPPEARDYEPLIALDGGDDGLDIHRRVAAEAATWLAPSGVLLIEASEEQAPVSAALFTAAGLTSTIVSDDELGATVIIARKTSS